MHSLVGITEWSKIAVFDTENHSADLYAHPGDYNVLQLSNLFKSETYIKAIETCEQAEMEVIIIDSFLDRNVGCQIFVNGLNEANGMNKYHRFVN